MGLQVSHIFSTSARTSLFNLLIAIVTAKVGLSTASFFIAMFTPNFVNNVSFHNPVGNTPAVCSTQDLRERRQPELCFLGCGDVRNILFTSYFDGKSIS